MKNGKWSRKPYLSSCVTHLLHLSGAASLAPLDQEEPVCSGQHSLYWHCQAGADLSEQFHEPPSSLCHICNSLCTHSAGTGPVRIGLPVTNINANHSRKICSLILGNKYHKWWHLFAVYENWMNYLMCYQSMDWKFYDLKAQTEPQTFMKKELIRLIEGSTTQFSKIVINVICKVDAVCLGLRGLLLFLGCSEVLLCRVPFLLNIDLIGRFSKINSRIGTYATSCSFQFLHFLIHHRRITHVEVWKLHAYSHRVTAVLSQGSILSNLLAAMPVGCVASYGVLESWRLPHGRGIFVPLLGVQCDSVGTGRFDRIVCGLLSEFGLGP